MKLRHWLPFISIIFLFVMYNIVETGYFTRTAGSAEISAEGKAMYPRTDAEVVADGICMLILAIGLATLGIIQTLCSVFDWFSNVKVTVHHVAKEEDVSKAAKDYQSTV